MSTTTPKTRLNIQFNEKQRQTLESMANELGTSKAGVLKKALSLLNVSLKEHSKHNSLAVVDEEGKVVKTIIGILD